MVSVGVRAFKTDLASIKQQTSSISKNENSRFGSVLSSIKNSEQVAPNEKAEGSIKGLSNDEKQKLLSFLQNQEILNIKNGDKLLNKLLSDANLDVNELAKETLSLSEEDLTRLINGLKEILSERNIKIDKENADSDELIENTDDLMALFHTIQNLPNQQLEKFMNHDFAQIAKFVKMVELLGKNQDSLTQGNELTKLMESVSSKLENLLNGSTSKVNRDFLTQTFRPVVVELNQKSANTNFVVGKQVESFEGSINLMTPMSRPEQLTLMLQTANRPVSTEQLIQQFESLLAKSQFSNLNGTQKLFLNLTPEHLGSLRIELLQTDQILRARILTTTGEAKEALESHLNGLKHALANQNIHVEKIEISQQFTPQERSYQRESQQHEKRKEENNQQQEKQSGENEFTDTFAEALVNLGV